MKDTQPVLVLFDIDRTLLCAGPEPVEAMKQTGQSMYGHVFSLDGVNRSGNLDALIFKEACSQSGIEPADEDHNLFHQNYCQLLEQTQITARVLPNAVQLLEELRSPVFAHVMQGVVTGNYECAGWKKLSTLGVDLNSFVANGFGHEAPTRSDLVQLAIHRAERLHGQSIPTDRILVVGDTPRDVKAAKDCGCRVWAVTTGQYDAEALAGATVITDALPASAVELLSALSLPL